MKYIVSMLLLYIHLKSVVIASDDRPSSCCLKLNNNRVQIGNLVDYTIQNSPPCSIRAVQFHTKKNKTLCWDPEESWAKNATKEIDARKTTLPPIGPTCQPRTSNRFSSTPIKTSREEPKTSTRKIKSISTGSSKGTTFKTTGPETKASSSAITSISTGSSKGTTLKTTGLETKASSSAITSISTRSSKETTLKTTEIKTSTKRETSSTENSQSPLSSTDPCTSTSTVNYQTTKRKTTPSKLVQRKRKKSKKQLRKFQMRIPTEG